jgi:flagellar basal body-associated protein FliL
LNQRSPKYDVVVVIVIIVIVAVAVAVVVASYMTWCSVIPKYLTFESVAKQQNYIFHEKKVFCT